MEKKRRLKKRIIALIVAGAFILIIGFTALGLFISYRLCDARAYVWNPSYEKLSYDALQELYDKEEKSEEDYKILFDQTGLTQIGIERAVLRGERGWERVKEIQDSYFRPREVDSEEFAPFICTDYIYDISREIYLERGDILITSSTHFSGFRIGHSGVIIDPYSSKPVFQSNAVGVANGFDEVEYGFTNRINFMVLRIKPQAFGAESVDDEIYRKCIFDATEYIVRELKDGEYFPLTGIFSDKNKCKKTSCSHLIWYGFKHFDDANGGGKNIDLDPNGGLLVTPRDISNSPLVELVQTFGFDPEKLYE